MTVRRLEFGSADYEGALALRKRVLRDPLGLSWSGEELAWEPREWQFGAYEDEEIVACLSVRWLDGRRVKLRQMAVAPSWQGNGMGRELVRAVEAAVGNAGAVEFELHSRAHAVGFYEKLGYAVVGDPFEEVGIPHRRMEKSGAGEPGP